jgi:hypothetical protein
MEEAEQLSYAFPCGDRYVPTESHFWFLSPQQDIRESEDRILNSLQSDEHHDSPWDAGEREGIVKVWGKGTMQL